MISRHFQSDGNTKDIVKKARAAGIRIEYWIPINRQKGMPDLIACHLGTTFLIEVKKPGEDLTDDQRTWHAKWLKDGGGPIATVHSFEELKVAIGMAVPF